MTNTITVTDDGNQVTLVEVGIAGPPGPQGSTAPVLMGSVSLASAFDVVVPLVASARYGYTITGLYGLVVSSGTTTLTIKINGVAVTGLDQVVVTTSVQTVLATANNVVAVDDYVTLHLSGGTSATDLRFTAGATPA